MAIELDPVDRITTDAIGEPGERVFYLQARREDELWTVLVEKDQVALLSASIVQILATVGKETAEGPGEEELALEEPIIPEWRAGRLSIGYHEERDLMVLEVEELVEEEDDEEEEREPQAVRLWVPRHLMLAFARHGADVVARGRPRCDLCGNPLEPEGHVCPALNGHRRLSSD